MVDAYDFYIKNFNVNCMPHCPLECDHLEYQITTTFSQYPTRRFVENDLLVNSPFIKSHLFPANEAYDYALVKESVLSLNVYFDDLSYTEYNQYAKTKLSDLISNVGGITGVFVGASLLSFIEIVETAIELVSILASRNSVPRKVQPSA